MECNDVKPICHVAFVGGPRDGQYAAFIVPLTPTFTQPTLTNSGKFDRVTYKLRLVSSATGRQLARFAYVAEGHESQGWAEYALKLLDQFHAVRG